MIADLKPYSEYKESGQPWIGRVPMHWEVLPLGRLMVERKEMNDPIKTENILSLSLHDGVVPYADKRPGGNKAKEDLTAYKLAYPGDIVLNSMNVVVGSVGLSKYFGAVSPVYYMLFPRHADDSVKFFDAIFQHSIFQHSLLGLGNGILIIQSRSSGKLNTIRMRIPMTKLKLVLLPYPPADEQAAIVRFLDWANGRLERAIRAKWKVIALLNEQKQTIIHRAVTRGLDPSVPLKPSGIPWLSDIPQHWEVRKLRHLTRQIIDGTHFTPNYRDDGVAFLRVTDIHEEVVDQSKLRRISKNEHLQLNKRCNPEKGDLLLSKNGTIGITKVVDWDFPFSMFVSLCLIKPIKTLIDSRFISFAFSGGLLTQQLADTTKTTSVTNLHLDKIRTIILPLPPLAEQSDILTKMRDELAPIDATISRLKREIELLREYRTRLVADVVTGKLDVREAASRLFEEPLPDTTKNDMDQDDEISPTDEEADE